MGRVETSSEGTQTEMDGGVGRPRPSVTSLVHGIAYICQEPFRRVHVCSMRRRSVTRSCAVCYLLPERKVAVVVGRTAGVEGRSAVRARVVGLQVGDGRHRMPAGAAQHGGLVTPVAGPSECGVIGGGRVALDARVVHLTAHEANRNHVPRAVVVSTAGLGPHCHAPKRDAEARVGDGGVSCSEGAGGHTRIGTGPDDERIEPTTGTNGRFAPRFGERLLESGRLPFPL